MIKKIIFGTISLSLALIAFNLGVSNTHATTSSITVTIESGTEDQSIDIPPTTEGRFVSSSATRAKVVSNHASGYILMISAAPLAFTDTNTNPSTTYTISPLDAGTAINADTFSAAANTQYSNKWGYQPSCYYDEDAEQTIDNTTSDTQFFFPAPINTTAILDETDSATSASGNTYDVSVGARIDNTAQTGAYTSTFAFTAIGQVTNYSITYNANAGSDTVSNMPSPNPQTGEVDAETDTVTLSNKTPTRTGYTFNKWCNTTTTITSGADVCSGNSYTVGDTTYPIDLTSTNNSKTLYGMWDPNQYTITLTNTDATTTGSISTKATYTQNTLSPAITNPSRVYTVSGLTNNGSGGANATVTFPTSGACTSTSNCKYTYNFNGWYTAASGGTQVITNAGALTASNGWTDSSSNWTATENKTAYAQWGAGTAITLPTITRTGSTCGWATSSSSNTQTYSSGQTNIALTAGTTLYGTCANNITLTNDGATTAGSTSATVNYGSTSLSNITVPQRKYTVSGFTKTTSATNSTVSSTSTLTNTATFNGWYTAASGGTKIASNADTPALQASTTYTNSSSQWTYTTAGAVTLHSQFTDNAVTLPTITRTGSTCGWSTSSTATTITYASGASFTPTSNTTLYGVCVNNVTLDRNGGNTGSTSTTVNYGATSLNSITTPTRSNTTNTRTVSGFTNTTSAANATVSSTTTLNSTSTTTYTFNGWYTATSGGTKIAGTGTTPALEASTIYTNSSKQWTYTTASAVTLYAQWTSSTGSYSSVTLPTITRTGSTCGWSTSSTATTITYNSGASITPTSNLTLYGVCRNNITLNNNGATTSGSTSATVNYNATSLSSITVPQRKYTVSGFTKGTNASSATISSTSTLTNTATFNGWYTASSGGTKIASNAATPALQASTTYTNSSSQWTYTTASAVTLYAQWTDNSVTLPTIALTGYNCGWSTSSTATSYNYNSGASITPTSNLTLYGICVIKSSLSLKVSFDSNVQSVAVRYGSTSGPLMGTVTTSGNSVSGLIYNANYYLVPTYKDGYEFSAWTKDASTVGALSSTTAANPYYTIGDGSNGVTLSSKSSRTQCDNTKLCVEYEGNGLTYDGETLNRVNYNSTATQGTVTKYAHMSNVGDDGKATGTLSTISTSTAIDDTQAVTIDGAEALTATLYYDTYSSYSYGYVSVYQSPFNITTSNDSSISTTTGNLSGRKYGYKSNHNTNYATWNSATYAVTGDTVKFHFYRSSTSTSYRKYYGYYAVITGIGTVMEHAVASGEYATPTGTNAIFYGWSNTQTTAGGGLPSDVEYANESEVMANIPGDNGDTQTLYAVWQQGQAITFNMDSNVSSIAVLDSSGATVGTITANGQSLPLVQGDTYTIKPTHASGYVTNAITIASGAGAISGENFTVGAGATTISITSKGPFPAIQNYNCANLANVGDTEEVYDSRDNEVYLIGKLADNKCWMLDNLRLDPTSVDLATLKGNTNASDTTLGYLKNGGGTTSNKYATAAVSNWKSSYSYSAPLINATYKNNTTGRYGAGSGKIGVYYNYCAASAGSYCYGNGTSTGTSSGKATEDLCPAGWRMPGGSDTIDLTATPPTGEFQNLHSNYYTSATATDTNSLQYNLSLPLSGYFNFSSGSTSYRGSRGYWWSSTRYDNTSMYALYVTSSSVGPAYLITRADGPPLRCVAK